MYTRGQFATIGKVGRKALRIYHDEGILIPAYINEENGYHYYEESQLDVLERIKRFRKIGLSLFEIKQVIENKVDENELINSKIREMDSRLQEVKEISESPAEKSAGTVMGMPDIRPFERCICLYVDENVELENLGMSVGKLYEKVAREGIETKETHFVIYNGLSDKELFSMRTCLPVVDHQCKDVVEIFENKCLHFKFTGGFSKVRAAHILIKQYADAEEIELTDKAYEVYNRDMSVDVYYSMV